MADCLLLLSDGMLAAPLSEVLRQHNPRLAIVCVQNGRELAEAMETVRYFDRMIAFCTETIVPAATLAAIHGPSYNFHPAPPEYPGSHPASFAIYDRVTQFGATAHEMAVRVDSGAIVAVEPFDVPPDTGVLALEDKAGEAAAKLFWRLASELARCDRPLAQSGHQWGPRKTTRKNFRDMGAIDPAISAAELEHRWRAFGARDPSIMVVTLHGRRFALVDEAALPSK